MNCMCKECGQLIHGPITMAVILRPGSTEESGRMLADLGEFDLLAQRMLMHVSEYHPQQNEELTAVMGLAGKVYSMVQGTSIEPKFRSLRKAWVDAIILELRNTLQTDEAAGAEAEPGADSLASKLKN